MIVSSESRFSMSRRHLATVVLRLGQSVQILPRINMFSKSRFNGVELCFRHLSQHILIIMHAITSMAPPKLPCCIRIKCISTSTDDIHRTSATKLTHKSHDPPIMDFAFNISRSPFLRVTYT